MDRALNLTLSAQAERDIDRIAAFYEEQEPGLGSVVYLFLRDQIDALARVGQIASFRKRGPWFCRVSPKPFPYFLIYYTQSADDLRVMTIVDGRRDPALNQSLLGSDD